jgi:hypothetical protein
MSARRPADLCWGHTDGLGELAHGIVADIEVAEALALNQARRERSEQVVREGKPSKVSMSPSHVPSSAEARAGQPLNLGADHIDDLVRQAGNVLVAQVDGDARLLLLHVAGGGLGGGTLADVAAGMLEGGLGQGHNLVVRDGRGGVVAHCGRGQRGPGGAAAASLTYMLRAGGARSEER